MSNRRFTLDTNILVYALDRQASDRHGIAGRIIGQAVRRDCSLTLQAVSEFHAVVTRKRLLPVAAARDQALDWMDIFPTVGASEAAVRTALTIAASGQASYWHALLLLTAAEAGCTTILTEDLADGVTLGGLRVIKPFAGAALSAAAEAFMIRD